MASSIADLRARAKTPGGQKAIRYTLVSVISVIVSQVSLIVLLGGFHWTAKSSNIAACTIGGVPSYWLNRRWAWGKTGKSHIWREHLPFWSLTFLGLALSTWAADFAESWAKDQFDSHLLLTGSVALASLGAFGVLWIAKFLIFNRFVFVHAAES